MDDTGQFRISLFQELVEDLDECIERAVTSYYAPTLEEFNRLLVAPSGVSDLVPTLIVRGQCIDWNRFCKLIEARFPDLIIKRPGEGDTINDIFDEDLEENQKLLLLLHDHLYTSATFMQVFTRIENRGSTFLVFHTPKTFSYVYERISRQMTTRMHINKIIFPPCDKFIQFLFDEQIPLGFMSRSCVHFHGKTLDAVQRYFNCENRSLANLRKILVLALHEFVTSGKQLPKGKEREKFSEKMCTYSALLNAFAKLSGENKLKLHSNIQGNAEYFPPFFNDVMEQLSHLSREGWRAKLVELAEYLRSPLVPNEFLKDCEQLMEQLEEVEEGENSPPHKATSSMASSQSFGIRRPIPIRRPLPKSSNFFAEQERKRKKMSNPLSAHLRQHLFAFLKDLFYKHLFPVPDKFVAGPGNTALLNPSLSTEIDVQLGALAKEVMTNMPEREQVDISLAFYLLITADYDHTSIPLDSLLDNFHEMAKPIEGMHSQARFMAAVAQLEHIGAVKMVSEGVVRLTYVPGAAMNRDLFQKSSE